MRLQEALKTDSIFTEGLNTIFYYLGGIKGYVRASSPMKLVSSKECSVFRDIKEIEKFIHANAEELKEADARISAVDLFSARRFENKNTIHHNAFLHDG